MQAGSQTAINSKLILLFLTWWTAISSANILTDIPKNNPLDIDWDPAPAPEDGPPLSFSASRDPSLLPAQIGGIVGAYLFCICIVGLLLIILGRKRRAVKTSAKALDIEMVEPRRQVYEIDPSPITPNSANKLGARNFSWPSPEKTDRNPYVFPAVTKSPTSPPGGGDPYVDNRIVQADREMLQRDLEDLYAHVMEQEDAKAAGMDPKTMPLPVQLQSAGPVPAPAPQRQNTPPKLQKSRPSNLNIDGERSPDKPRSRTSSIISSLKSPKRKGIRGMRISSPIPTPQSATFSASQHSDEEPLTPRFYSPPPPPPVPKDQYPYTHQRNPSSGATVSPTRSIAEQLNTYDNQQFHRPNPSQTSVQSERDPSSATSATSSTPLYPLSSQVQLKPPTLKSPNPPSNASADPPSNNSSVRALPFRQFEPTLNSPSFSTMTKTTVLERTGLSGGPRTGGLRTPWSAGAVPYSPYQPFTPVMPITPRLVTKEERKAKKKAEGRTPVMELIKSEDELWDSGY